MRRHKPGVEGSSKTHGRGVVHKCRRRLSFRPCSPTQHAHVAVLLRSQLTLLT